MALERPASHNLLRPGLEAPSAVAEKSRKDISSQERMQAQNCFSDSKQARISWVRDNFGIHFLCLAAYGKWRRLKSYIAAECGVLSLAFLSRDVESV
ncbi:hypothetical protein AVEN_115704-1 [Araneus ventricosus]|uniref:Uncharacterized protein n=1 Tax=Araneus ventricosus TaxID=182803 RepID=A0A4Y2KHE8_ARAVE|nr:hypothetical protein AVEN_115704-1 [Araneus ventricosus]